MPGLVGQAIGVGQPLKDKKMKKTRIRTREDDSESQTSERAPLGKHCSLSGEKVKYKSMLMKRNK